MNFATLFELLIHAHIVSFVMPSLKNIQLGDISSSERQNPKAKKDNYLEHDEKNDGAGKWRYGWEIPSCSGPGFLRSR